MKVLRPFRRRNKPKRKTASKQSSASTSSESHSEEIGVEMTLQDTTLCALEKPDKEDPQDNRSSLSLVERWSDDRVDAVQKLWKLTPEQHHKLLELKSRIVDIDHWKNDPYEAIRFLLEKRDNVDRAEHLFRDVNQWRLEHNVDDIFEDYHLSPIFNYFPIAVLKGVDHEGDPIHLERPCAADCWSFYQRLGADEIYQMAVYMREMDSRGPWQQLYEQQQGHPVRYFTVILDLEGLSHQHLRPALIGVLRRVLFMSQDQYPFLAKKIILLRAPRLFKAMWSIAQHFVYDSVKKLIVVSTQHDYLEVLNRYMDRSVVPPCICREEGRGEGTLGYEKVQMEGGKLPPVDMTDSEIEELLEKKMQDMRGETTQSTKVTVKTQPIMTGFLSESIEQDAGGAWICLDQRAL